MQSRVCEGSPRVRYQVERTCEKKLVCVDNKKCGRRVHRHGMPPRLPLMTQVQHFVSEIKKRQR